MRSATKTHDAVVVHVLPFDLSRGAQVYAKEICEALDTPEQRHVILTLFDGVDAVLGDAESLGVPRGRLREVGFDPRVAIRLHRHLVRTRPAAVVAYGSEPFLYAAAAAPRGTPIVYYRIGVSLESLRTSPQRHVYRLLARRAGLVAGMSQEALDDAHVVMGVPEDRLRLVPNARDPARFERPETVEGDARPLRLIWVGHMGAGKRPEWFIDAVAELRRRGFELSASLAGDGPLFDGCVAAAEAAGVELLGRRDDIAQLLAGADIFCFTSDGENEGLPGVLIEAGMAQLAAVATDVAGARSIVADGETGMIVPPTSFEGYVAALAELVADPARVAAMGDGARVRCIDAFGIERSAERWRGALAELIGAPR